MAQLDPTKISYYLQILNKDHSINLYFGPFELTIDEQKILQQEVAAYNKHAVKLVTGRAAANFYRTKQDSTELYDWWLHKNAMQPWVRGVHRLHFAVLSSHEFSLNLHGVPDRITSYILVAILCNPFTRASTNSLGHPLLPMTSKMINENQS